jgi:hypothetical protein
MVQYYLDLKSVRTKKVRTCVRTNGAILEYRTRTGNTIPAACRVVVMAMPTYSYTVRTMVRTRIRTCVRTVYHGMCTMVSW